MNSSRFGSFLNAPENAMVARSEGPSLGSAFGVRARRASCSGSHLRNGTCASCAGSHRPSGRRRPRLRSAAIVLAVAVAAMTWFGQSPASARSDNKSKPVLFVHGYNPTSTNTNCGGDFDWMISTLRSQGFTGSMVKVGYYTNDSYCSMNLHSYGSYGDRDSWRQISKAFSWYVYNTYTRYGIAVDAVGYSMGGLIVRGAIHGSSRGESGFSPPIDVEDAVTLGTPHTGAAWYSNLCLWGQCSALKPGSSDLNWLNTNGNQQGKYGTEWTTFGSNGDWVVPASSAAAMALPSSREYTYSSVPHTGSSNYMHNSTVVTYAGYALGWATW